MYSLVDFVAGIALGAAVALVIAGALRWLWARRRADPRGAAVPPGVLVYGPGPASEPTDPTLVGGAPVAAAAPEPFPTGPGAAETAPSASVLRSPSTLAAPSAPAEQVRLSRRVVLHLFSLGRADPDDVGSPAATQAGIGRTLGAGQSAVSKVLRRLVAAGVVEGRRRHVRGADRRMNVYALTRSGERLAHELIARARIVEASRPRSPAGPAPMHPGGASPSESTPPIP